ncbi:9-O-acetylesterase [Spirochaetia bacterium]|nr:9-O-acetylesterase [Spirochaetia bacterium]
MKLAAIFRDGMVLQRNTGLKIWGWAKAGLTVRLRFALSTGETVADADGKWLVTLPEQGAGGPFDLIACAAGEKIIITDILVGDVWLLSGQSNMAVSLGFAAEDYAKVKNDSITDIRYFGVPLAMNFHRPQEDLVPAPPPFVAPPVPEYANSDLDMKMMEFAETGIWRKAAPEESKYFSGVGYFFARALYEKYKVPIGLVNTAVGGIPIEAFMSRESLKDYPAELGQADRWANDELVASSGEKDKQNLESWNRTLDALDLGLKEGWQNFDYDDSSWGQTALGDSWKTHPDMPSCGAVWFRREITIPPELAGKPCRLVLGMLVDGDRTFVNGKLAGYGDTRWMNRDYGIKNLKAGRNVIAIRIHAQHSIGWIVPGEYPETSQHLVWEDTSIPLDDAPWRYRTGALCGPLEDGTVIFYKPTGLYNGMIAPLHNMPVRGALWYQGESHTVNPNAHADHFCRMVDDWRSKWDCGDFPFIWVQLPNFAPLESHDANWAFMREEQRRCLRLKNSAMAAAIDAGVSWDIHPRRKKIIGERLALAALYLAYKEKVIYSGPVLSSVSIEGKKAILHFTHSGDGLASSDGGPLRQFTVFDGQKEFEAEAVILGETVEVICPKASEIKAVRYAWKSDPKGANFINKNGLPALPFDTGISLPWIG